jgi:hypothetical protein
VHGISDPPGGGRSRSGRSRSGRSGPSGRTIRHATGAP